MIGVRGGPSLLDFKLGLRMLIKYPGLTLIGSLAMSVAIAIGAAYFEFSRSIIHPSLPLPDGGGVVGIQNWDAAATRPAYRSLHDFVTWRDELKTVDDVGAFTDLRRNLIGADGRSEPVRGAEISASAFRLVRTPPLLGRPLVEADEIEGAPSVVVIGYDLWQSRFGGDPGIVGRAVRVGRATSTVVGIMPAGFAFPIQHALWTPLRTSVVDHPRGSGVAIQVFGRLAPGVTLEQAQSELTALGTRAATAFPETNSGLRPRVMPYAESMVGTGPWQLYLIHIIVVMILIVACANVATLVFARIAARESEIAIRNALGASRGRVIMQLFIEALVLATVAAAIGLAVAGWGLKWGMDVFREAEGAALPFWIQDSISPATWLYVAVLVVLSALITGVVPALKVTERRLQGGFGRATSGGSGLRFGGLWTGVIVTQVALSVAFVPILISEGWDVVQYQPVVSGFPANEYLSVKLGVDRETALPGASADTSLTGVARRFAQLQGELRRRVESEPGVIGATFASRLPGMDHPRVLVQVEDTASSAGQHTVREAIVDAGFFDALEVPVRAGRAFQVADLASDHRIIVVNESFVQQVLGGRNPIGQRVRRVDRNAGAVAQWYEIIGVVRDLGMNPGNPKEGAGMYRPMSPGRQEPLYMGVHVASGPGTFAPRMRSLIAAVDPALLLNEIRPLGDVGHADQLGVRVASSVLALLVFITLMLSTAGIYALMSFTVSRRTREIGIRAALGADPRRIVAAIFSRALTQVTLGVVVGAVGAVLLVSAGVGEKLVTEGPWLVVGVAALMMVVGLAACALPAGRALRVQPTEALRHEG